MDVLEAIQRKRAVRSYTQQPLPEDVVDKILKAGRRSQSSKNSQPWQFIAIRNRETLTALSKLGDYASYLPDAALVVALLTPDPRAHYWVMFDAGQAAAYMQLAAVELGVGSCIVTLHRPEPSREILGYPEDLFLRMVVAFGYPADPMALEPASKPGGRRPMQEAVHFEHWNSEAK
ncbi:MAG: nitroreductase family protein [Chloroflexota bacterium]|nr:nitroreductase family protein [Chloroflexota bacterium]